MIENKYEKISTTEILEKLRNGILDNPTALANYLVQLSATLYTSGTFELEARMAYAAKWLEIKNSVTAVNNEIKQKTDKMVEMESMTTDEYREYKKMEIANKAILETIRSLKHKLKALTEEMQLSR